MFWEVEFQPRAEFQPCPQAALAPSMLGIDSLYGLTCSILSQSYSNRILILFSLDQKIILGSATVHIIARMLRRRKLWLGTRVGGTPAQPFEFRCQPNSRSLTKAVPMVQNTQRADRGSLWSGHSLVNRYILQYDLHAVVSCQILILRRETLMVQGASSSRGLLG